MSHFRFIRRRHPRFAYWIQLHFLRPASRIAMSFPPSPTSPSAALHPLPLPPPPPPRPSLPPSSLLLLFPLSLPPSPSSSASLQLDSFPRIPQVLSSRPWPARLARPSCTLKTTCPRIMELVRVWTNTLHYRHYLLPHHRQRKSLPHRQQFLLRQHYCSLLFSLFSRACTCLLFAARRDLTFLTTFSRLTLYMSHQHYLHG